VPAVYSTQFLAGFASSSPITSASVPGGHIWIVRSITATNTAGVAGLIQIISEDDTFYYQAHSDDAGDTLQWEGRAVLEPGAVLLAVSDGDEWVVNVSGYDLTTP
jgi:hypothetical protein